MPRRAPSFPPFFLLLLVLGAAAALRFDGIRYGLPLPVLNPDESNIVPRAWRIAQGGGLDPGWYDYPSLLFYILAPFQAWQDAPSYLSARIVVALAGVAGVAAAWILGRSAFGLRAAIVGAATTAVATAHVAYSHMAVTDVPLTLAVTVALALAVAGRLEAAGLAVGLAASVKYPGVLLVVPLVVAGWGQWRRLIVAGGIAAAAFLATSPFVLLNARAAAADIRRVGRLADAGWLGFEDDHPTPIAYLDRLWESVGPLVVVGAIGLALALARRRRADLVLVAFAAVYFVYLLPIDAHFDRYVLPLVPVVGVLAGRTRALAVPAVVALAVPLVWSLRENADLRRVDTRLAAREWVAAHLAPGTIVAADPSTLPLDGHRVIRLALPGPGRTYDERRDVDVLRARRVRYVVVSGAVADRVLAARDRYPREAAFYDELPRTGRRVLAVEPGGRLGGPWVAIYRL